MAKRIEEGGELNDGFLFPDSANGLATVCPLNTNQLDRIVWDDGAMDYVTRTFDAPYFEDPPCPWRAGGKLPDPMTPPQCQEFCSWLNGYTYEDCKVIEPILDDEGNEIGRRCALWGTKYLCAQTWVEQNEPNCKPCIGRECRCEGVGCTFASPPPPAMPQDNRYKSFFREYVAETERKQMVHVSGPELLGITASDVGCYGFYWEYDPKYVASERRSYRCVIDFAIGRTNYIKLDQLVEKQAGTKPTDPSPTPVDRPAVVRNIDFDPLEDLWYPNLGAGLSFLTGPVFDKTYQSNLSRAFLNLDVAKQIVPTQVNPDVVMATGALQRSFDDTVSNDRGQQRTVVQWWQALQHRAVRIASAPVLRLKLPAEWVLKSTDALSLREPGTAPETLELELQAGEEVIGEIGRLLEKEFVLQTYDVPVVIPDGSPELYHSLAQRWHDYEVREKAEGRTPPAKVTEIQDKLKEYAHQIEKYRELRVQLPQYYNAILDKQEDAALAIVDWLKANIDVYKAWNERREEFLAFREELRPMQDAMQGFNIDTNFKWCRNDAFTTSIYSLLDPWLPTRPKLNGGVPSCEPTGQALPILCLPAGGRDLVLDLTYFRMQRTPIVVAVPQVTRVHLQLPTPPNLPSDDPPLPDLPDVPVFSSAAIDQLPEIVVRDPRPLVAELEEPEFNMDFARQSLQAAQMVIAQMRESYERFWTSWEKPDDAERLECADWSTDRCWYVEPELIQTFTRLNAHPGVFLKEHFTIAPSDARPCDPAETVCLPAFQEWRPPARGWQLIPQAIPPNAISPIITQLRNEARQVTLTNEGKIRGYPDEDDATPYLQPDTALYPLFQYAPVVPLLRGSSSSASS